MSARDRLKYLAVDLFVALALIGFAYGVTYLIEPDPTKRPPWLTGLQIGAVAGAFLNLILGQFIRGQRGGWPWQRLKSDVWR